MTTLIPPPPPTVPIGRLPNGTPVFIDLAWARYLSVELLARVGGTIAPSITEIVNNNAATVSFGDEGADEVFFVPGPPGPPGPSSVQMILLYEETQIDDIVFIPR